MTVTSLLSACAALAFVLGIILLSGRVARMTKFARGGDRTANRLGVVEQLSLDAKRRLMLVRCDGRCVLILAGQQDLVVGWLQDTAT